MPIPRVVLLVLALALPRLVVAQEGAAVRGRVLDLETREPVAAAVVRLVEVHRVQQTHEDGSFRLADLGPGRYTLTVTRLGYRPAQLALELGSASDTTVTVLLAGAAVQLARQVVTGTLSARSQAEVLSATSALAGAELDRQLGSTLAGTLQNQAGVAVTSIGPATGRPVIRGLSGDRIVVLEDGQRPGDLSATSGDHAVAVEPLTAERIEVVRGPMSLLYGSSALGGVVNVIRDEVPTSRAEHVHGTVVVDGASVYRGGGLAGAATASAGMLGLRAEGSLRGGGDVRTPAGSLVNTDTRTTTLAGGAALVGTRAHAGASYRYYANDYGIPGGFIGAHPGGVDIRMRRHGVKLEAERHAARDGAAAPLRAAGQVTSYRHDEVTKSGSIGTRFDQDLVQGDLLYRHAGVGEGAVGAVGVRGQFRDIVTAGALRTPSTRDWSGAMFVVEELRRGALTLQGGARYDWSRFSPQERTTIFVGGREVPVRDRTFSNVSGSLGALWHLGGGVRVGASAARAFRTPDFNELYSDGPHLAAYSYDVGDPDLKPETGLGADLFVRLDRQRVRGELAAFRYRIADYVFPSSRGRVEQGRQDAPRFQFTNEDLSLRGAEARLAVDLTRWLVLDGTGSVVLGRFTNARPDIPVVTGGGADTAWVAASRFPPLTPPARGRLALRHEHPRWFVEGATRLSARQERTGDFEDETAGYALLDASAGWRLLVGSRLHAITLRLDNALDHEYRDHLSRTKVVMPEPGRNVSLLYRLTF